MESSGPPGTWVNDLLNLTRPWDNLAPNNFHFLGPYHFHVFPNSLQRLIITEAQHTSVVHIFYTVFDAIIKQSLLVSLTCPLSSSPLVHTQLLQLTDCTLVSWFRPEQCYSTILPSATARQAHIYKDTLALCLVPFRLAFIPVSLQTRTLLPVNKYSLSFRIINTVLVKSSWKDQTVWMWAYINTKHTELHCWEILLLSCMYTSCLSSSFFFWLKC